MNTDKTSAEWNEVIAALVAKETAAQSELAALATRKEPLCLAAVLGDKAAQTEIKAIDAAAQRLSASLFDLTVAAKQAAHMRDCALQQEQKAQDWVKVEAMQNAIIDRLWLLERLDEAAKGFVDLVVQEIEQREKLERLTGVKFKSYSENSLLKTLIVKNLIDRHWQPGHHLINMERGALPFKNAADGVFGAGWVSEVNNAIYHLVGPSAFAQWPIPDEENYFMETVPAAEPTT